MFNLNAVFSYQKDIKKTSGNKLGLEIEAHIKDLEKIKNLLWNIKEDNSLPKDAKEGITYPLELIEAFSLLFYIKKNFKYVNNENLGLHIHFNILDRNLEVCKYAALKFKEELSCKVKYFKKTISFFRDENPYSNWFSKDKYHVINLREATIEFRAMGLKKLKSLSQKEFKHFLMFIETFLYYLRNFNSKEEVNLFWDYKIKISRGSYFFADAEKTLKYILFNEPLNINTYVLDKNLKVKLLKNLEVAFKKYKTISWTYLESKLDFDFKFIKPILPKTKVFDRKNINTLKYIIQNQTYALKKEVDKILCVE